VGLELSFEATGSLVFGVSYRKLIGLELASKNRTSV
jgi:hypothetical protein